MTPLLEISTALQGESWLQSNPVLNAHSEDCNFGFNNGSRVARFQSNFVFYLFFSL